MTSTIQSSIRLDDGTIHVIGGNGFDDFYQNLLGVYSGDVEKVTDHIHRLGTAFIPGANEFAASQQAVGVVQQGMPGTQVINQQAAPQQGYQTPQYPPAQQGYAQQPPQQYPAPAPRQPQAAPPGAAPTCAHGARGYKTGTYKNGQKAGQAYAMWKCPAPQGQDCSPIWL